MSRALDVASSYAATLARGGVGLRTVAPGPRAEKPLELYDFEACPFCRKAREALCALDLEVLVLPCPKGGPRFREEVRRRGGKAQFPYLVDPNTGKEMYESDDIVDYLFERYGSGPPPALLARGALTNLSAGLASALRPGKGAYYHPARPPERPLELYSFEASPYCRLVRESLSSLELPYRLHNVAKGSPRRAAFLQRSGRMQVPWLLDPNTGAAMFESADIVAYLERTYTKPRA
jgi:glutathione S-transferase